MTLLKQALLIFLGFGLFITELAAQDVTTIIDVDVDSVVVNDGMVQGANGTFYVSSFIEGSIYKFDLQGNVQLFATGLETSNGLLINQNGDLMACDPNGNRIYVLDTASGAFTDTISIHSPAAILKVPNSDTLLVTDWRWSRIYKLAPDGSSSTYLSGSPLNAPVGICYLPSMQSVLVGNFNDRKIHKIDNDSLVYVATVPALNTPGNKWLGFIASSSNRLFGTSINSHTIYEIFPNYVDSVKLISGIPGTAGHKDGALSSATYFIPNGILPIGNGDTLLVSDYGNSAIRVLSLDSSSVGVETFNEDEVTFSMYPNPVKDLLYIQLNRNAEVVEMRLISILGAEVEVDISFQQMDNQLTVKLKEEYKGYYIIQLKIEDQWISSKILVD